MTLGADADVAGAAAWRVLAVATMFIRHRVADYGSWRRVYDETGPVQKAGKVIAEAVYQADDDPNDVTVTHEFGTLDDAHAFAANPELKAAMDKAGVIDAPTIWFTNRA